MILRQPALIVSLFCSISALKHTLPGDLSLFTEGQINAIVEGHTSGHVER
ncbi:MAG TPA: hypothetical protein VMW63_00850 [Methanoregulaceae archaeon]|nr:hypothetical protein [Methanoregulaceae archaeon]